jgi:redox-sensitive bicupin YhaK (pirin superfamily)
MTEQTVLETAPLGNPPWPTIDPFLFCVHHDDAYPAGNDQMGPDASLAGRTMGNDFAGKDGWRMYHGRTVPGFPQHPHRGFETVTIARRGYIDHSDSLGAAARFGQGDVQWMTAGRGVVHSEMFPLVHRDGPNPAELFQIWLNLPRAKKMAEPHFTMLWHERIPVIEVVDPSTGARAEIAVVAGAVGGHVPPPPPPDSWAADPANDVAIWSIRMEPGSAWTMPAARTAETVRAVYVFAADKVRFDTDTVDGGTLAVVRSDREVVVHAGGAPVEILVLQGRPIGEPVAQYGPFVLNDRAGIQRAFEDYQRTGFGGWPWPADDPVHARDEGRFARHADGRVERPVAATSTS